MKANSKVFVGCLIVVFTAILVHFSGRTKMLGEAQLQEEQTTRTSVTTSETKRVQAPDVNAKSASTMAKEDLRKFYPDKNTIKEEVVQDPHKTPDSLITFAEKLGPKMDQAMKDKNSAQTLLKDLNDCLVDDTVAQSARALCLSSAERIGKAYPEMNSKVSEMRADAPKEVVQLIEKKNMPLGK